ncbi:hypothetical protein SHIRM173S_10070 [Streptomyces hirsutus]
MPAAHPPCFPTAPYIPGHPPHPHHDRRRSAVLALALTACGGQEPPAGDDGGSRSADIGAEDQDKARGAAGLPPEPSTTARYRFLEALDAIDRRIAQPGTDQQAVSRGLDQCGPSRPPRTTGTG